MFDPADWAVQKNTVGVIQQDLIQLKLLIDQLDERVRKLEAQQLARAEREEDMMRRGL